MPTLRDFAAIALAVAILASMAAAPPSILRVRAPATEVGKWFPKGTELISLKPQEFEALAAKARGPSPEPGPYLLRVEHRARWDGGLLGGRSTFTVRRDPRGPALLPLEPWDLAADPTTVGDRALLASDDGHIFLRVAPEGPPAVDVAWHRAAKPHSDGHLFALDLPRVALASLELDLPERLIPEGFAPAPTPAAPGRRAWRKADASGPMEVRLRDRGEGSTRDRPWISGPSTVDVGPSSATWRGEWSVELDGPDRTIRVGFSPGLEPTEATGADVESTEVRRVVGGAEMTIRLRPSAASRAAIQLRGLAAVPPDKPWPVPSAWPIDAEWLGGDVTVRLDRSRALGACRVLRGRRLPVSPDAIAERPTLRFEPTGPGSVAELTFVGEAATRRAEVRGAVRYAPTDATLDARIRWTSPRGRPGALAFDLPSSWSIERISAGDVPLDWHREPLGPGLARVRLAPPPPDSEAVDSEIRLRASSAAAGDGPRDLPRVRPVGVPADELWVATAPADRRLVPRAASGIAWLDPARDSAAEPARGLAWRWTGEEASAEVAIASAPRDVLSRVDGTVEIAAGRVRADWRLTVRPGPRPLASIPLAWSDGADAPASWRIRGGSSPDRDVAIRAEPARAGVRASVALDLPEPTSSTIVLEATSDRPWTGRGPIPLPLLPAEFHGRGRVAVRVGPGLITRIESRGLGDVDDPTDADSAGPARLRLDRVLTYGDGEPRLTIETIPSRHPEPSSVAACRLVTSRDAKGRSLHRLSLRFLPEAPAELVVTMPAGTDLIRARRGERILEVIADGPRLRLPIHAEPPADRGQVVLDYEESGARADGRLAPTVPTLSVPILHFLWTIAVPAGREVDGVGPGLVTVDPSAAADLLGPFGHMGTAVAKGTEGSAIVLDRLRSQLFGPKSPAFRSLGEQVRALAGGDRPVVVDRVGFEEAGLGPDSPPAAISKGSGSPPDRSDRLEIGPLCIAFRSGVIAVTPRSSEVADDWRGPASGGGIDEAVRAAAIAGESPDARWMAAEEWCASATPAGVDGGSGPPPSGSRRHFACNGRPGPSAWVEIAPASGRPLGFVLAAAGWLGLGLALRPLRVRRRVIALALLTLAAYLALWSGLRLPEGARAGVVLGLGSAWLVQPPGRRRPTADPAARGSASTVRRASPIAGAVVAIGLASAPSPAMPADPPGDVILAILPYEGAPDLRAEPTRAILRLADFERLKAASAPAPASKPSAYAEAASHRVEAVDGRHARVISDLTLVLDGTGPVEWRLPTLGAWEIRATLDGRDHPVRIGDAGGVGIVAIEGTGSHRLRVERAVGFVGAPDAREVVVPINAVPIADLKVSGASQALGPAREIRVGVPRPGGPGEAPGAGFRGLILWDALPSGDRLRLRLTASGGPAAAIRLGLDPGVRVRVPDRRRLIRSAWEEKAGAVAWSAAFDPPCEADEPVEIELWRPSTGTPGPRRMPNVAVEGGAFEGVIGFRRPPDWSGRLDDPLGFVGRDEESFVTMWGRLPDEPLTLAGAIGFRGTARAEVAARPVAVRRTIRTEAQVDLGEGRLDLAVTATIRDLAGQSTELDVDLPPGLVSDGVIADGLMGLSWPGPGRVHLELTRVSGATRQVTIRGHVLVSPDSALVEARHYRASLPRPVWSDATEEPGALTIVSGSPPSAESATGAPADMVVEPLAGGGATPSGHRTYRVGRSGDVASIRWQAAAPRVGVFLQSRLAVGEGAVDLDATIRYEVAGGPLDVVYLRLPTAWAAGARAQLVGDSFQQTTEARGDWTTWTIRPDRPIWGTARLRIHARRNAPPGPSFTFPEISPLGQGRVEKVLSVERTTGAAIELEGSAGLQAVDPSRLDDGWPGPSGGTRVGVYRVAGEKWSLTIRPVAGSGPPPVAGQVAAREAETRCALGPDGSAIGTTTYLVDARLGRALCVGLGPGGEVLAASAGGRSLPVLSSGDGVWSVPFDASGPAEVDLLWRVATAEADGSRGMLVLPRVDGPAVPTLVRITAPDPVVVRPGARGLEGMGGPAWRVERAERLARRVLVTIGDLDRSSSSEEAELSGLLARFALEARLAARSDPEGSTDLGLRLEQASRSIAESLDLYGLDDFRPMLEPGGDGRAPAAGARPAPLPLGRATSFRSASATADRDESILWELRTPTSSTPTGDTPWAWPVMAAIVGVLLPRMLGAPGFRSRAVGIAIALALVGLMAVAPIPGLILLLAAWAGLA